MDRRFLFVHNPISGGSRNNFLEQFELLKPQFPNHELITTTHVGHAKELAEKLKDEFDVIVAVGGDGTINEIASSLVHSNTKLGIIPQGSGNGLAHHLGIPMKTELALKQLRNGVSTPIDVIEVNNHFFVNVAGVGFDGHVNILFNQTKLRGLWSYARFVFTEYMRYKEFEYSLVIDGEENPGKAFVIALANSTQYGNNFHIAPNAKVDDGLLHISLIKKPPFYRMPYLLYTVFKGKILRSKYCTELKGKEITLKYNNQAIHFDGEIPHGTNKTELHFKVLEGALEVVC